jgi:hypothetical protein
MAIKTWALGLAAVFAVSGAGTARAQVPANIEAGLRKIGQVVDPACTAKLYRPLMPKNDYNTYWPPTAPAPVFKGELYPGITIARDQSFGPNPKDLVDIFVADKGGENRPVFIYVPGGGGNKIEQQDREANAFYDNIGRWATKNGMVGVTVQRHPGMNWDDPGRDISMAVDWVYDNIKKYHGDPTHMYIMAHSAGNGPLGQYVGHADRWKNGVRVRGAIFTSGNPVPSLGGGRGRGAAGGRGRGGPPQFVSTCGEGGPGSNGGMIAGPSAQTATGGGRGRGRGPQELTAAEQAERDNLPGFKKSNVKMMLIRAELDPGVTGGMAASDHALHDALCSLDGPNAKDGVGHCPVMVFGKGESHMGEVFAFDSGDKNVTGPILAWIDRIK